MKKILITALLTGLIAGVAFADSNVVSSANIVGYVMLPEPSSGVDIVSPQFLLSSESPMTLGEAFSDLAEETLLYSWDGTNYTSYIYYNGYGWYDFPAFSDLQNDVVVNPGQAFWLSAAGTNALTSGDVPSADTVTNVVVEGINLIANPYPVALTLGSISNQVGSTTLSDEDLLYAWDGSTYVSYAYYEGYGWYDFPAFSGLQNDVEIPVGKGFWLSIAGVGGDLVFTKQY